MTSLGSRELDALVELASIGSGQALTALGKLIHQPIAMDVPEAWVGRAAGAVADFLGASNAELIAVGVRLDGLLSGHLVLALPLPDAERLARHLGRPVGGHWTPLDESALMESGNIVASAFVSAIARMVGQTLLPSVPTLARGGGRSCLDRLADRDTTRMALATRFSVAGAGALEGLILVMPDADRIPALLAALDFA